MRKAASRSLVDRFSRLNTLVIGDLMLDHFIWGSVSRISPEAPVPVVEVARETQVPGGAGNVAVNLASLGAEVHVIGLVGEDAGAEILLSKLAEKSVRTGAIVRTPARPTVVKTRIIAQHQQVVRFDRERRGETAPEAQSRLWERVRQILPTVDAVILSDYAKGVLSPSFIGRLVPEIRRRGIPVTVDPKPEHFRRYRHVTSVTPNLQEAMEGAGVRSVKNDAELDRLGLRLLRELRCESVLITRGEKGMSLIEKNKKVLHIPTRAREVFDVTGAGDTVISVFTLALAAGASPRAAAELANDAAGIVVAKLGTASVTPAELLKAMRGRRG